MSPGYVLDHHIFIHNIWPAHSILNTTVTVHSADSQPAESSSSAGGENRDKIRNANYKHIFIFLTGSKVIVKREYTVKFDFISSYLRLLLFIRMKVAACKEPGQK